MLRDGLSHVLSRGRRDVIRKRAPKYHQWQSRRRPDPSRQQMVGAMCLIRAQVLREVKRVLERDRS